MTRIEVPCPLCGSEDRKRLFVSQLYAVEVPVVECRSCGLLYQSPRPSDEDLVEMYDEKYYTGKGAAEGEYTYADERTKEADVRLKSGARLARMETLVKPGRLLEIGCSFGTFLDEARTRGWSPVGVDVSEYAVEHCRKERDLEVHLGKFEDATLEPASFRAIHMSEVIEHLSSPREALAKCRKLLEPAGLIVIGTANADSMARRLRGSRWGYFMPGHLVYFSTRTLPRLLEEEGYRIHRVFRGDDHGRWLDGAIARAHASSVPGRLLRRWVGAGMVVYAGVQE